MAVVAGDVVRIVANMLLEGVAEQVNVWHFIVDVNTHVDDAALMVDIAAHLDTAYTLVNPSISAAIAYVNITGQNVTQDVLLPDTPWPVLTIGGISADRLPDAVAAEVYWGTATPKVVGKKFLPNMTETANNSSVVVAATLAQLASFAATFIVPLVTANLTIRTGAYNVLLARFTEFILANVPVTWRTQRRRRRGVGS